MADLITVDEYKDLKGITSGKEDTKLDILVPSVSQLVKTYCGHSIVDHYTTNKVESITMPWGTHIAQLSESPLNTVVSVEERKSITDSYTVLTENVDYYVDKDTDSVLRVENNCFKAWSQGAGSVRVTYTAGYMSCPADLKLAVADLITYYLKDEYKQRQTLSGASIENPETSLRNSVAFPDHIKRVLDLYKVY